MDDMNQDGTTKAHENGHQMLPTPPSDTTNPSNLSGTMFVSDAMGAASVMPDELETKIKVKQEPTEDMAESTDGEENEDDQNGRPSALRLREDLQDFAKNGFTPAEAAAHQADLENATHDTYFVKNVNGKWIDTHYVANLETKFDKQKQAWIQAEAEHDSQKDIVDLMAGDPARYQQAVVLDQLYWRKEALRRTKLSAEAKWKDHKALARGLKSERIKEEERARKQGVRQRKKERTATAKAKAKEKAAGKAGTKSKGKAMGRTTKARSTKGRRS